MTFAVMLPRVAASLSRTTPASLTTLRITILNHTLSATACLLCPVIFILAPLSVPTLPSSLTFQYRTG